MEHFVESSQGLRDINSSTPSPTKRFSQGISIQTKACYNINNFLVVQSPHVLIIHHPQAIRQMFLFGHCSILLLNNLALPSNLHM